jgi:hypothetical protein
VPRKPNKQHAEKSTSNEATQDETRVRLDLRKPGNAHRMTPASWKVRAEAAAVTLERFHAAPPPPKSCALCPEGEREVPATLSWKPADDRERSTHANENDATEDGAYAIAMLAVHAIGQWRVTARTHQGSGSDFRMVRDGAEDDFMRLEVSGVAQRTSQAGAATLTARLREKVAQLGNGDLDRPGMAVVVGFEAARVLLSKVCT